ncbi:MarR family winged helix-turn-helix transcriptional regulator [Sphingomonas sp. SORGH_AS_0879]|uniref:MarR family winged helix-turn-helix transcriptional regulator n=1 Tax=Sphingomonas sp. SORGH_AS_0879 TaxID=3041790 RepID=UPI0027881845|nr:MarR family transcriptional regulator [Sphingomonas sp. SORGH_AS_0879]MDQ1231115.1 MarR family transcriptional regulator for hemolysin [Sphingomonas sp. SORGH_AS_0879]
MTDSISLRRHFSARLVPMARAYRRYLDRGLAGLSLSHTAALAVMLIGRTEEGMRQGALADQLGMEAPSVVPLIDQLERSGLVERRVDATDKRARLLHLTNEGRTAAAEVEERTAQIRSELFADVDDVDLKAASRVLDQLYAAFGDDRE